MPRTSHIDLESCWKALGGEMFRECNRVNHHFPCRAGEARFMWLIKHTMFASINDFPRPVILKGAAKHIGTGMVCFAIHFYADEARLPEDYALTIDENMGCSLSETEARVSIRDMCRRFFDLLCSSSPDRKSALT